MTYTGAAGKKERERAKRAILYEIPDTFFFFFMFYVLYYFSGIL